MQVFINIGSFEEMFIQGHTNSHPEKSHFGPLNILFRTPGGPRTPGWEPLLYSFEKKLSKEEGRISALYLYINFSKLSWYKSETLRILSNLKMLLALDVLLLKVMYFKIRFCSTCTGRITVLYARPQSIMQYCKCEWKRLK